MQRAWVLGGLALVAIGGASGAAALMWRSQQERNAAIAQVQEVAAADCGVWLTHEQAAFGVDEAHRSAPDTSWNLAGVTAIWVVEKTCHHAD